MKLIKPHRDITITQTVNGGWLLIVGCETLPYTDINKLLSDIKEYVKYPVNS